MRVCAISDLHGLLPPLEACDLLLLAGDLCPVRDHSLSAQWRFLDGPFRAWLAGLPARHIVGVAGNHDFIFERAPKLVPADLKWCYLQDSSVEKNGMTIYGTPWQPWFRNWAFNLYEDDLKEKWNLIPDRVDVLLLHGPPSGFGDLTTDGRRTGSPSLLKRIEQVKPKLVVFGHIHESFGHWTINGGETTLANVSHVNEKYRPIHAASVFEL